MAELADAQASGACGSNIVWVQVPSSALKIPSNYAWDFFVGALETFMPNSYSLNLIIICIAAATT